jgi:glucose-6-phosphate-specific signal transduction histidine kinase
MNIVCDNCNKMQPESQMVMSNRLQSITSVLLGSSIQYRPPRLECLKCYKARLKAEKQRRKEFEKANKIK